MESSTKRALVKPTKQRNPKLLELTHSDISGKISTTTLYKSYIYVVLLDDSTARSSIHVLKNKAELLPTLKQYKSLIENKFNYRIIRSDWIMKEKT